MDGGLRYVALLYKVRKMVILVYLRPSVAALADIRTAIPLFPISQWAYLEAPEKFCISSVWVKFTCAYRASTTHIHFLSGSYLLHRPCAGPLHREVF